MKKKKYKIFKREEAKKKLENAKGWEAPILWVH